MLYCEKDNYKLYNDNMLNMLDFIPKNSVASIITDPPYEISFMGKGWDNTGVAYQVDTWKKCLEVLKPGGYLLVFGATRTFHRIACAIEDAGFEIRDTMMWLYGSGFPKSMNVGLAIDKKKGIESKIIGEKTIKKLPTTGIINYEKTGWRKGGYDINYQMKEAQNKWNGWGTCLKPAYEPIIVARKPFNGSLVDNVLKNGVGAINIDECRIGNEIVGGGTMPDLDYIGKEQKKMGNGHIMSFGQINNAPRIKCEEHLGRFPANVITDGSEEVAMGMPDTKGFYRPNCKDNSYNPSDNINFGGGNVSCQYNDEGSAMRYFYTAKASKKDRDEGLEQFNNVDACIITGRKEGSAGLVMNNGKQNPYAGKASPNNKNFHPTVKPVDLMQYLVRMFTPKGETIMDCFMGSGSTGKAVMFENRERNANYKFIGIEMTKEYLPICEARIDYALNKYEYDFKQELKETKKETGQMNIFDVLEDD